MIHSSKRVFAIVALLIGSLFMPLTSADESQSSAAKSDEKIILNFGVVPQQAASKLARNWGPILKEVSLRSGITLRFKTAPDIPTFEERLAAGEYDVAYMNPYHYTVFNRQPGYRAFGKALDKVIKGIVVVAKDSKIEDIRELSGEGMAFPAPAAFAASVLPRAHFKNNNIDVQPNYVSSHDSVYRAVAKGLYPAGGGVMRTFNTVDPAIKSKLRILWKTNAFTSHALAAHPDLSQQIVDRIIDAMVSLSSDEKGEALLNALAWKGVQPAGDEMWDDVRGLGIDILDALVDG